MAFKAKLNFSDQLYTIQFRTHTFTLNLPLQAKKKSLPAIRYL